MNWLYLFLGASLCFAFGFFAHGLLVAASERGNDADIYEDEKVRRN